MEKDRKKNIFIAISFGASIRDVLRSDMYYHLRKNTSINLFIFSPDINEVLIEEFGGENIFFLKLNKYTPSFQERIVLLIHRAILRRKSRTIDLGNTSGETLALDIFTPLASVLYYVFGLKFCNSLLNSLYQIFSNPTMYISEFEKFKPDLVIVTRLLNYSPDYPIMRMSNKYRVPVIALVSSWDNLTSKGFFPFGLESVVVWNEVMKIEAQEMFLIDSKKIFVSGIPRFDKYFKSKNFVRSREEFFADNKIPSSKKLLLYCTGSSTTGVSKFDDTSPEPAIAKFLADKNLEGFFGSDVFLIVRLHPQAVEENYEFLKAYENTQVQVPGRSSNFHDRIFSDKDELRYIELLKYSSVMINIASTVTIDAAVFDLPIVCINFDFFGDRPLKFSVKKFYEFEHYRKLRTTNGFDLANSREEMIELVNRNFNFPERLKSGRNEIVNMQCGKLDGKAGERIAEYILNKIEDFK